MIRVERPVRFEDVDAAGIVFFARFFGYAHDAMERFFGELPGGYVDLITRRRIGFPSVHVACDYRAPLRYGDVAVLHVEVAHVGTTSCGFSYELFRKADGVKSATIAQTIVTSDLASMVKMPIPDDVRELLERHRAPRRP